MKKSKEIKHLWLIPIILSVGLWLISFVYPMSWVFITSPIWGTILFAFAAVIAIYFLNKKDV